MLDKKLLVKTLEEMVERRNNIPAHLMFYSGPQKSIVEDILLRIQHGEFDAKDFKQEDKPEEAVVPKCGFWDRFI